MDRGRRPDVRVERSKDPARKAGSFVFRGRRRGSLRERVRAGAELPPLHAIARESYRHERLRDLTLPVASGLVEAGVVGVIADKVYDVRPALLALISAAPMFGNLSSVWWARLAEGRPKVPVLNALHAGLVALVVGIALLPAGAWGGWLLAADVVLARILVGGILTVRSIVWTLNYPSDVRSRVTARLSIYTTGSITLAAVLAGLALDADPQSFRWVYPLGGLVAVVGLAAFSRVQLLGEREHLAAERNELVAPHPEASDAPESALPEPAVEPAPGGLVALLRNDPLFARYQLWQFLIGSGNMIVEGPLVLLVSRDLGASYSVSIALTLVIPLLVSMITMPLWAPWMDRVHIAEFRAKHSILWALSQAATWGGAAAGSLFWIGVGRTLLGFARGGGILAWQIGHNDFASPDRAARYMGVHVTLTGLRGAIAPFLGMALYVGWGNWDGIGPHMMGVAAALSTVGTLGYVALWHRVRETN